MAKPVRIEISFQVSDFPGQAQVYIPPDENYRELLFGAQVGDVIDFMQGDKRLAGKVATRGFSSRSYDDPDDSDWMFQLSLSRS
ncbi:hypothetical protein SAMN03159390_04662 [Pseudomonas sp. NFACC49-2]|uniref:hypothetical protein n=1 Tax=Pseudomonas sp. NFACC49-2 TaxID=1566222 RepID=UPI000915A07B|nr:hypothetical protein [Pseudomonas sp. NFACC49-2]SFY27783.1 hypothetical protein SAMN03159390_04662 [Pseudomonas sp. NFACC49-2]